MFGVGLPELAVIAFVAVLVFGPDKLPEFARQAGRMARKMREFANEARDELREELGPEFADLELQGPRPAHDRAQAHHRGDERRVARLRHGLGDSARRGRAPALGRGRDVARRLASALHRRDRVSAQQDRAPLAQGDLDEVAPDPGQHHRTRGAVDTVDDARLTRVGQSP